MPNHIRNRIAGPADLIERITRDGQVDFNLLIPQPEIIANQKSTPTHVKDAAHIALGLIDFRNPPQGDLVAMTSGGNYGGAASILRHANLRRQLVEGRMPKDFNDEEFDQFITFLHAYRECGGLMDWYDWNTTHWGTKWNAYDSKPIAGGVEFDTAWNAPHAVIERLAEVAQIGFTHLWADEDTGANAGRRVYRPDATHEEARPESYSNEAYEIAFDLRPDYRDGYKLVDGKYEYEEEA